MSSAVAEIQQDLQKERRSRGGGSSDVDFDEAEVYMWVRGGAFNIAKFFAFLAYFTSITESIYNPNTIPTCFGCGWRGETWMYRGELSFWHCRE